MLINQYVDSLYEERPLSGETVSPGTEQVGLNSPVSSGLDISSIQDISPFDMSQFDMSSFDMSSIDMSSLDMASIDMSSLDMASIDMSSLDMASLGLSTFDLYSSDMSLANLTNLSHKLKQVKRTLSSMCNPPFI